MAYSVTYEPSVFYCKCSILAVESIQKDEPLSFFFASCSLFSNCTIVKMNNIKSSKIKSIKSIRKIRTIKEKKNQEVFLKKKETNSSTRVSDRGENFQLFYALSLAWQLGFLIVVPIVLFLALGIWLDRTFHTGVLFLFVGIIMGIGMTFYEGYHVLAPIIHGTSGDGASSVGKKFREGESKQKSS